MLLRIVPHSSDTPLPEKTNLLLTLNKSARFIAVVTESSEMFATITLGKCTRNRICMICFLTKTGSIFSKTIFQAASKHRVCFGKGLFSLNRLLVKAENHRNISLLFDRAVSVSDKEPPFFISDYNMFLIKREF